MGARWPTWSAIWSSCSVGKPDSDAFAAVGFWRQSFHRRPRALWCTVEICGTPLLPRPVVSSKHRQESGRPGVFFVFPLCTWVCQTVNCASFFSIDICFQRSHPTHPASNSINLYHIIRNRRCLKDFDRSICDVSQHWQGPPAIGKTNKIQSSQTNFGHESWRSPNRAGYGKQACHQVFSEHKVFRTASRYDS